MPARQDRASRTPARIADRPTWLISRAFARSSGLLSEAFEERGDGLRSYHYRLLAALEESGPASQADLGRDTGIDRSDVTPALRELEARALVVREVDPHHQRRNIVSLTAAGIAELGRLDRIVDEVQDAALAPLTEAQRRQVVSLLRRLLDNPAGS
jgi:DNA-binding MarR family transcriptional regulator